MLEPKPKWPVGESMVWVMVEIGQSQRAVAEQMDISEKHLNHIVNGRVPLSAEFAMRFEYVTGMSADMLMKIQAQHQADLARDSFNRRLEEHWSAAMV